MFLVIVTSCIFVNNKLVIGIVLVIILGAISLVLNNTFFHIMNIHDLQPVSTSGSPRHISVNMVENIQNSQSP